MIPNIKKILFATNLSQKSRYAFEYAVSIANQYGAAITILYVMEERSPTADLRLRDFLGEEMWQGIKESHEQEARKILIGKKKEGALIREKLGEFCEEVKADLGVKSFATDDLAVAKGNVVDEILTEAQNRGCDLIVMGYHVRGKLEETILGSTTRRVLRRSKTPVMLIRLPEEDD